MTKIFHLFMRGMCYMVSLMMISSGIYHSIYILCIAGALFGLLVYTDKIDKE